MSRKTGQIVRRGNQNPGCGSVRRSTFDSGSEQHYRNEAMKDSWAARAATDCRLEIKYTGKRAALNYSQAVQPCQHSQLLRLQGRPALIFRKSLSAGR